MLHGVDAPVGGEDLAEFGAGLVLLGPLVILYEAHESLDVDDVLRPLLTLAHRLKQLGPSLSKPKPPRHELKLAPLQLVVSVLITPNLQQLPHAAVAAHAAVHL